jgi:outer membrane biosynthesis protein TonB
MSDHDRGAYTPPTDAPLSFDARQPVRGSRPLPWTLILSLLVLIGLAAAIFLFYRSGVRQAGEPPQAVGAPVGDMKGPPPAGSQPQDPAAGLQIYRSESGEPAQAVPAQPQFVPPPEQPQARPAPPVAVQPLPPAPAAPASAPVLRAPQPAPQPPPKPVTVLAPKPAPPPQPLPKPIVKPPAPKPAPAPAAKAGGAAAVQIGAFSSQALADKGWSDAAAIAPGAAAGKGKQVEEIEKDGHTLFRTAVTGFSSREAAAGFCSQLKAAGKSCFVK